MAGRSLAGVIKTMIHGMYCTAILITKEGMYYEDVLPPTRMSLWMKQLANSTPGQNLLLIITVGCRREVLINIT
jgi:hypothetical protein